MGQQCNGNCNQGRSCNCDPLAPARGIVNGLLIVAPFWLCVIALVLLTGCTAIGHKPPPEDWPRLTITQQRLDYWPMQRKCGVDGILMQCTGYAWIDFNRMTCEVFYTGDDPAHVALVIEHELDHCAGKDHIGMSTLADAWAEFKRQRATAQRGER